MFTLKLVHKVNGREVSQEEYADHLKGQMLAAIKDSVRAKIEAIRCPVHGTTGKAVLLEDTGANFRFGVEGCCDALGDAVKAMRS